MKTEKQVIGRVGEDLTNDYFLANGFRVIDRNYLKKWGEIDLVACKDGKLYFIEVKTITRRYTSNQNNDNYRAEDNLHLYKAQRLKRTIQTYLLGIKNKRGLQWQFDLVVVVLSKEDLELISIKRHENIIL